MQNQKLKLGYWNSRGRAHPLRQFLHITGQDFEDITYASLDEWHAARDSIFGKENAPFGNIPYIIDGDYVVNESAALPIYIAGRAGKPDLLGKNYQDKARHRQIEGVVADLSGAFIKLLYNENRVEVIKGLVKEGSPTQKLARQLSEFLGKKEFLLGYLTYADLYVAHFVQFIRVFSLSLGVADPFATLGGGNLLAHAKRVNALAELATFKYNFHPYAPPALAPWLKEFPLP